MAKQTILEKINQRERQLLVHCCLYYGMNENIISDDTYDKFSFDLADLIKKHPNAFKKSVYYYEFRNFNPSTGLGLNYKKPEIIRVAHRLKNIIIRRKQYEKTN